MGPTFFQRLCGVGGAGGGCESGYSILRIFLNASNIHSAMLPSPCSPCGLTPLPRMEADLSRVHGALLWVRGQLERAQSWGDPAGPPDEAAPRECRA